MSNTEQSTCPHGFPSEARAECPQCKRLLEIYQDPDYETLYRYENPATPYDPAREGGVSKKEVIGWWFTTKKDHLADYIRKKERGGRILIVRIPKTDLHQYDAMAHPWTKDMDIEPENYIIPPEVRAQSQLTLPIEVESKNPKRFMFGELGKIKEFIEKELTTEKIIQRIQGK